MPGFIQNSLVVGNGEANCTVIDGTFNGNVNNLDDDGSCAGFTQVDDPLIGPLADNGGPTLTHALLPDSPALDAGDNALCSATDQRGVARPQNDVCDIGAFELEVDAPTIYLPFIRK